MSKNLDLISIEENTDKSSISHNYASKYDSYFKDLINNEIKLLEIGVLNGDSIRTWNRYFNNASIYGVDINENCKNFEQDNVKIFIGNQSDINFLSSNFGDIEFDIIIDDGSHIPTDQINSFLYLFYRLKPGGLYVIEDLHSSYSPYHLSKSDGVSFINFIKEKIDDLQLNGKDAIEWSYGCKKRHLDKVGWDKLETYNYFEKNIEFIHIYKSICFIKKEIW